jgi:hypothetical protein
VGEPEELPGQQRPLLGELYQLAAVIAADATLMRPSLPERSPALQYLRNRFIEEEIPRLLISTAAASRVHDEHMSGLRNDDAEMSFQPVSGSCGRLWPDALRSEHVDLGLREACNKIVHALSIEIQTEGAEETTPINPVAHLRGRLSRREWRCDLDLLSYVALCVRNLDVIP